jgi:signal peptidase I
MRRPVIAILWLTAASLASCSSSAPSTSGRVTIRSPDMTPTLKIGDVLKKVAGVAQAGDFVEFSIPTKGAEPRKAIERMVAIGPASYSCVSGRLVIADTPMPEPYLSETTETTCQPGAVGNDQCLVLGDNRTDSYDSRIYGAIPCKGLQRLEIVPGVRDSMIDPRG